MAGNNPEQDDQDELWAAMGLRKPMDPLNPAAPPSPGVAPASIHRVPVIPDATPTIAPPRAGRESVFSPAENNISHKHPFWGGVLKGLDVAGSVVAPRVMSMFPTTMLGNRAAEARNLAEQREEAQTGGIEAQTREANARAASLEHPEAKPVAQTPEEKAFEDLVKQGKSPLEAYQSIRTAGVAPKTIDDKAFEDLTKQGKSPYEAWTTLQQGKQDVKPQKGSHITYDAGIPVSVTDSKGNTFDVNDPKLPAELKPLVDAANRAHKTHLGEQADIDARKFGEQNERQNRQQTFQNTREARKEIQGIEKTYRQAKEAGDALNGFIDLARQGNKEAAATVPLEGTLRIVTSQGVKRINRTEVEGIEGAGSMFDRIEGKLGKWTKGQPIPPDLLNDFQQLNNMLTKNAYQQYSEAHDQITGLYGAGGVDPKQFKKQAPPKEGGTGGQWSAPTDAPPAPKEDGKFLKADGLVIAKSQGGKWVQP